MRFETVRGVGLVLALSAGALAACGDDGGTGGGTTSSSAASTAQSSTSSASSTATSSSTGGACDGDACIRWGRRHGGPGYEFSVDLASHPAGGLVAVGGFFDTITVDPDTTPIMAAGAIDGIVVRYDKAGELVFAKPFGGPTIENLRAVATAPNGDIVIAGFFRGPFTLDGITATHIGDNDVLVMRLTASGAVSWIRTFGSTSGSEIAHAVAIDSAGDVYLAGGFVPAMSGGGIDSFTIGTDTLTTAGLDDIFVAKLTAAGDPIWARSFGGTGVDSVSTLALDPAGDLVIGGSFTGALTFGLTPLTSAGLGDGYVTKLAADDGEPAWAVRFGGTGDETVQRVATEPTAGDVVVVGSFEGTAALEATMFTSAGLSDVLVAKLDGADGGAVWANGFGGADIDGDGAGVAVTSEGDVVVGTMFQSPTIDAGSGTVTNGGASDGLLLRFSGSDGAAVSAEGLSTVDSERVFDVAIEADDNVVACGTFYGGLVFGADTLTSAANTDNYVASLGRIEP